MKSSLTALLALFSSAILFPKSARAEQLIGVPLVGATSSPDQFVVGGRLTMKEISGFTTESEAWLGAHSSLVLGFGNNQQVFRWAADASFHFPIPEFNEADLYAFGGFSLANTTYDACNIFGKNCNFTEMGIEAGVGLTVPVQDMGGAIDASMTLGFGNLPAAMITVGYAIPLGQG